MVKEMVLALSMRANPRDRIPLARSANSSNMQGNHQLQCLRASFRDCTTLSSPKTQLQHYSNFHTSVLTSQIFK